MVGSPLGKCFGVKTGDIIIFYSETDLDWFAADFAVFDVGLAADGYVQNHRNLFSAVRTGELVFHQRMIPQSLDGIADFNSSFSVDYRALALFRLRRHSVIFPPHQRGIRTIPF
jgi:hypothetical protein